MNRQQAHTALGTTESSTPAEIKKAYQRLASKHHPDKNAGNEDAAKVKFQEAQEAYDILTGARQPEQPRQQGGFQGFTANTSSMEEILRNFRGFGFNGGGWSEGKQEQKQILNAQLAISIEEAFNGCEKTISIPSQAGTHHAETITIPPGLRENEVFKVIETGTQTVRCFIKIASEYTMVVPNHPFANLINQGGGDITKPLSVSPFLMMQGGFLPVPCIDGTTVNIRVPAGLEAGQTLRIQGKGYWMNTSCELRGDVYLQVQPRLQKIDDIELTPEVLSFVEAMKQRIQTTKE